MFLLCPQQPLRELKYLEAVENMPKQNLQFLQLKAF